MSASDTTTLPTVSHADIEAYERDGFLLGPVLFSPEEVAAMRTALERTFAGERDFDADRWPGRRGPVPPAEGGITHLLNGWWVNQRIRDTVLSPRVASVAAALMGAERLRLLHDQVLSKQPTDPQQAARTNVGWHQDYAHWTITKASRYCTAWIALQDTDLHNGGMRFIRGSHRWGLDEDAATFGTKDLEALRERFSEGREWEEVPAVLKAGQVSFHDGLTMHGSGANYSDAPRQAILVNVMTDDAVYRRNGHPNQLTMQFGPFIQDGDPLGDPWFPLVWPSQG